MSKTIKRRRHAYVSVTSIADPNPTSKTVGRETSKDPAAPKSFFTFGKYISGWWLLGIFLLSVGVMGAGLKYLEDTARDEILKQKQNPLAKHDDNLLAMINPFMPVPTPTPTPQLSKSYIYAGSRLLAVEDAGASAIPPGDLAVWRPSNGIWYCFGGVNSQAFGVAWGTYGDTPVPGDYDGDGKTDLAIYRSSSSTWWIYPSGGGSYYVISLGSAGDIPAPADFDGDGKTDPAVFHQISSSGYWNIAQSSTQSMVSIQFGQSTDKPAPADFDGDGKADPAVWRPSNATFYASRSSNGQLLSSPIGSSTDLTLVPADYDGDGKADFAIRHGDDWQIKQSSDNQLLTVTWYTGDYTAVQNDYDGDGKVDIAVWKSAGKGAGNWYIRQSSHLGQSNELRQVNWGTTGDIPVPAFYRR
jgi:hypothetical protein